MSQCPKCGADSYWVFLEKAKHLWKAYALEYKNYARESELVAIEVQLKELGEIE